ncbi:MAG: hypothetical protein JWP12_2584 [Bacteroidetes bacterium]|nr:hypothetical protein [Bacteroidota bacterium]
MNKQVYESFKKLNETERAELIYKFKNSPTVTRFIDFIEKLKSPNFKTMAAIDAVYSDEKEQTAYAVLENRFFKLRKKILDELESFQTNDTSQVHAEEELKFLKAKLFIATENKETGYKQLLELEKVCWEKNIFELLPAIIDQLIFCNQSFNRLENNVPLYTKQQKAIELQADMNRCCMTARQVYEINFTVGVKFAKKELNYLRTLAVKHKAYPRFLLCYHHVSAYYKLGSKDYSTDPQVLSRHLSAFKKLQSKYPQIPLLTYKVNYVQLQHMHFNSMVMSYHFTRCEFEESYQIVHAFSKQMDDEHSVFKTHKTEAFFYNLITAQCMTHRYSEAMETINNFAVYLKNNHQTDKLMLVNAMKARIYSEVYPQTYKMDPAFLLEQTEEYAKVLRKSDNMMTSLDQTLILRIKLLIIAGAYKKAVQGLKEPVVTDYLKGLNLYDAFAELISILTDNSSQKHKQLQELNKSIQLIKHRSRTPAQYMHIFWLQHYIKHLLA